MCSCCAVIPSLNPDENIIEVVKRLKDNGFEDIILVNDGSASDEIFVRLHKEYGCAVIKHCVNLGKGRGMKNALNYYMNNFSDRYSGVVFVDDDGQHDVDDVLKCCKCLEENMDKLVLGVRDFSKSNVPLKSRWGNRITSQFFRFFCGLDISDTQTGLRAVSNEIIPYFIAVNGERYEYETNMLLETPKYNIPIAEVPIKTIYKGNNEKSHFNPIKDSAAIYKNLIGYFSSSIASAVIDLAAYQIMFMLLSAAAGFFRIGVSTAVARVISSAFNYTVNKKLVFASREDAKKSLVKYYVLCVLQMVASYGGVYGLSLLFGGEDTLWIKIIVDCILFFISFKIQQLWVFKKN